MTMFNWFASRRLESADNRIKQLEMWRDLFNSKVIRMAGELEALKAAVAADAEMDAKFVAAVAALVTQIGDLTAKLHDALNNPNGVDPAAVKAVADELSAHVADMSTHLPPDATGAA